MCDLLCDVQDATHCTRIIRNKINNFIFAWKVIHVYNELHLEHRVMDHVIHYYYLLDYLPGKYKIICFISYNFIYI